MPETIGKRCPIVTAGVCANSRVGSYQYVDDEVSCIEDACQWWWKCREPQAVQPQAEAQAYDQGFEAGAESEYRSREAREAVQPQGDGRLDALLRRFGKDALPISLVTATLKGEEDTDGPN